MSYPNQFEIHEIQTNDGNEGNHQSYPPNIQNQAVFGHQQFNQGQQYNYPPQDFQQQQQFQPQFQNQQQFYQFQANQLYYQHQNFPQGNFSNQNQFSQNPNSHRAQVYPISQNHFNLELAKQSNSHQELQIAGAGFQRNTEFDPEWMNGAVRKEKRTKNDRCCLWIYLFLLVMMIALVGFVNNQEEEMEQERSKDNNNSVETSDGEDVKNDSNDGKKIALSAIAMVVISFLLSFLFVYITPKIAKAFVWTMIVMLIFFNLLSGLVFFSRGRTGGGSTFIFFGLVILGFVYCFRERIRQGIVLLKVASQLIVENLSLLYVPVVLFVVFIFFLSIWLFAVNGIGKLDRENELRDSIGYFIYMLYWTMEILNGLLMVTFSQVSSKWYFTQNHQGQPAQLGERPIKSALKISMTYHIGSVALGASVMGFMQIIKFFLRFKQQQENGRGSCFYRCFGRCIFNCIEGLVRRFNKSAYIFMGLTGLPFKESAKKGFNLILSNLGRYKAVELVGDLYQIFGVFVILLLSGMIGYGIASSLDIQDTGLAVLVYVITSWPLTILFTSTIYVSTDCMLFWAVIDKQINGKITVGPPSMLEFDEMIHK